MPDARERRLSVMALGSGGPISNAHRASAGYIVSVDERPRILVDAGGGIYERIGRCGLDLSGIELILLTHMHIDHTSDLPAVVMNAYMRGRGRPIALAGPAGRAGNDEAPENASPQPGAKEFVRLLFGPEGAWRYMNTFDGFRIDAFDVPSDTSDPAIHEVSAGETLRDMGISICATAVPHGMMPSIAFRVDYGKRSVAFSGDVSASTEPLIALAKNCSLLVHDFALPQRDVPDGHLHAKPSAVGRTARESGATMLLLSHFMPAIEDELGQNVDIVRREYAGKIEIAKDLATYELP
jgi:ribonuclease BN (tRNA processing enzyme)